MKPSQEIALLERITGGDPEKALRNRRVKRSIQTIRSAWAEEQGRAQSDLHDLLSGTPEWRWPLRVYTPEDLKSKEECIRAELSKNCNLRLSFTHFESIAHPELVEGWWRKIIKTMKSVIPEIFNRESRDFIRR